MEREGSLATPTLHRSLALFGRCAFEKCHTLKPATPGPVHASFSPQGPPGTSGGMGGSVLMAVGVGRQAWGAAGARPSQVRGRGAPAPPFLPGSPLRFSLTAGHAARALDLPGGHTDQRTPPGCPQRHVPGVSSGGVKPDAGGPERQLEMGRVGGQRESRGGCPSSAVGNRMALGWALAALPLQWPVLSLTCCPPATVQTHTKQGRTTEPPLGLAFRPWSPCRRGPCWRTLGSRRRLPGTREPPSLQGCLLPSQ